MSACLGKISRRVGKRPSLPSTGCALRADYRGSTYPLGANAPLCASASRTLSILNGSTQLLKEGKMWQKRPWILLPALWEALIIGIIVLILTIILSGLCQGQNFGSIGQMQMTISLPWSEHYDQTTSKEFGCVAFFKWGNIEYGHTFVRNLLWTVPVEKEIKILDVRTDKPFTTEVSWCAHRLAISANWRNMQPSIGLLHSLASVHLTGKTSDEIAFNLEQKQRATMVLAGLSRRFGVSRDTAVIFQVEGAGAGHGTYWAADLLYVVSVQNATVRLGYLLRQTNLKSLPMTIHESGPYARLEVKW